MRRLILILALCLPAFADCWQNRYAISVSGGTQQAPYTVRLKFGAANSVVFDSSMGDSGADWRFYKSDGGTLLPHWFEFWGTDTAVVLVKLDTLKTGASTIYLYIGNPTATNTSTETIFPLFQDFNTDFTVSGVTDILHMDGLGADTFRSIVMDTCKAENQQWRREEGNVLCNTIPGVPASWKYLHIYSAYNTIPYDQDTSRMYLETSSDGFTFTRRGRLDTLGGKPTCDSVRGEDAYTIIFHDTLWTFNEDKAQDTSGSSRDLCGLWYSANYGASWTLHGLVSGVNETNNWLYNRAQEAASPAAIVVGDTIWLMLEGQPGHRDIGCFWSLHPKGPWHLRKIFYNNAHPGGYWYTTGVPDQLFSVNDTIYMDSHCEVAPAYVWFHTRYRLGANFDTLLDTRIFSNDSILAGSIIIQDIFRDSSWMAWDPGGSTGGGNVRYRTMFTDASATPAGWTPYWSSHDANPANTDCCETKFGILQARNGVMTLACEPWRSTDGSMALGLRSDTGFTNNFVIEYRMKLKWDTLGPLTVVSFGSGHPEPMIKTYTFAYQTTTDNGYGMAYATGLYSSKLFHKGADSSYDAILQPTIPDSMMNTFRVNHFAFANDTSRFWIDGFAGAEKYDPTYKNDVKRILLAAGEGESRSPPRIPRGAQSYVDWLLVRPYQYPEPTVSFGSLESLIPVRWRRFGGCAQRCDVVFTVPYEEKIDSLYMRVLRNGGVDSTYGLAVTLEQIITRTFGWQWGKSASIDEIQFITSDINDYTDTTRFIP